MPDGHYSEEKRKRETEERERKNEEGGRDIVSPRGRPLCIQPNPDHDEKVLNNIFPSHPSKNKK